MPTSTLVIMANFDATLMKIANKNPTNTHAEEVIHENQRGHFSRNDATGLLSLSDLPNGKSHKFMTALMLRQNNPARLRLHLH